MKFRANQINGWLAMPLIVIFLLAPILTLAAPTAAEKAFARSYAGRIINENGANNEGWYIDPISLGRIYLGSPEEARPVLKSLALGISNKDFANVPLEGERRTGSRALLRRLAGRVIIKVQDKGKTYYIHPLTYKAIPLITDADTEKLINQRAIALSATRLEQLGLSDFNPLLEDNASNDADKDGFSDLEEINAGTSPFRSNPQINTPKTESAATPNPFTITPNASSTTPSLPPTTDTTASSTAATTTPPLLVTLPGAIYGTTSKVTTLIGAYRQAPNTWAVKYEWDFTFDGSYDFVSTWQGTVDYLYANPGTYTALFRVTDNLGRQAWGTVTIYITGAPSTGGTASSTTPTLPPTTATTTPQTLNLEAALPAYWASTTNKVLTLTGAVKPLSPGVYLTKYEWDYESDGIWDFVSTWQGTVDYRYITSGIYKTTFRATDNLGRQATASTLVYISSSTAIYNPPTSSSATSTASTSSSSSSSTTSTTTPSTSNNPTASSTPSTIPSPTSNFTASLVPSISGTTAKVVTLSGAVSGLGSGNYTTKYEWDYTSDGTYDYVSAGAIPQSSVDYRYETAGTYTATFRATDNLGRQATASMVVNITQ